MQGDDGDGDRMVLYCSHRLTGQASQIDRASAERDDALGAALREALDVVIAVEEASEEP